MNIIEKINEDHKKGNISGIEQIEKYFDEFIVTNHSGDMVFMKKDDIIYYINFELHSMSPYFDPEYDKEWIKYDLKVIDSTNYHKFNNDYVDEYVKHDERESINDVLKPYFLNAIRREKINSIILAK
jgi:hypothetical protein